MRPSTAFAGTLAALTLLAVPGLSHAMDCTTTPSSLRVDAIAPLASELATRANNPLGSPNGVLSQAYDEAQSVDQVLLRIRIQGCQDIASATPAPSVVAPDDPAAYKPKTQFDNTPWRFNMSQNGKNMTADEFSAWMKSRGVRVARGAGTPAGAVPAVVDPNAPPVSVPVQSPIDGQPPATPTSSPTPR